MSVDGEMDDVRTFFLIEKEKEKRKKIGKRVSPDTTD